MENGKYYKYNTGFVWHIPRKVVYKATDSVGQNIFRMFCGVTYRWGYNKVEEATKVSDNAICKKCKVNNEKFISKGRPK